MFNCALSVLFPVLIMSYNLHFRYDHSAAHAVYVVISVLVFHFIITGAVMATCYW